MVRSSTASFAGGQYQGCLQPCQVSTAGSAGVIKTAVMIFNRGWGSGILIQLGKPSPHECLQPIQLGLIFPAR